MNPAIFRQYDIRGLAETDLTDDVVCSIGKAFGTIIRRAELKKIALGTDVRLSSHRLKDALSEGILSTGCDVIDVGVVPTPVLYFSIFHYLTDGGIMITGSHNPKEYNGFKLCKGETTIYGDEIQDLKKIIEKKDFIKGKGSIESKDPVDAYIELLKTKVKIERPLKIIVDPGNGTAGPIARKLFKDLGCEVECIYCEPDGNFPNHLPDPTVPEYIVDLIRLVKGEKADLGIGYDGDGDRIGVIDENGNIIWGDKLLALFSKEILEKKKGLPIIFEVKCSQGLVEFIESHGGVPIMWKTGHSLIKAKMKEEDSPLAGEMSGHMFFKDNYYGYDDAIFASLRLLQIISKTDEPLSKLASEIPYYHSTPEIRVDCSDETKFGIVEKVRDYFKKNYDVIDIDGVRVLFGDGWGLVRASNTQPVLVLRFEAKTEERLEEIKKIVLNKLREFPSVGLKDT